MVYFTPTCITVFLLFTCSCLSFPVNHYSLSHRLHIQEQCESLVCRTQANIINTEDFMPFNITNTWHENPIEFQFAKPHITDNKCINIHSCVIPQWDEPCVLYLKMVGQAAFLREFGNISVGSPLTAKDINKRVLCDRLQKRTNIDFRVNCLPDIVFGTKPTSVFKWFKEKVSTEYDSKDKRLYVRSPSLVTAKDVPIRKYAGLHYMKILTPEFADYLIDKYGTTIY